MVSFLGSGAAASSSSTSLTTSPRSSTPDVSAKEVNPLNPKGLKPCCACPETKAIRDDCFLKNSPEEADGKCRDVVEAHKACMRSFGFKV